MKLRKGGGGVSKMITFDFGLRGRLMSGSKYVCLHEKRPDKLGWARPHSRFPKGFTLGFT